MEEKLQERWLEFKPGVPWVFYATTDNLVWYGGPPYPFDTDCWLPEPLEEETLKMSLDLMGLSEQEAQQAIRTYAQEVRIAKDRGQHAWEAYKASMRRNGATEKQIKEI